MINQRGGKHFSRPIDHMFYSKETSWGYPTYACLSDVEDPEKGYIKDDAVDFEVNNMVTKKGVSLSPSLKFGNLWWRFRLESSKKVTNKEVVEVEVFLVCEGLNSQGGGAMWSCDVTGKVELVNRLDPASNKHNVNHFANRKLNYKTGSLSCDKIPVDLIGSMKNGNIMLKARVVVGNFNIIQSARYAKMLKRRKDKETQHVEDVEKAEVV